MIFHLRPTTPIDVTRIWTTIKPGDQLSGLTFTLAQGAGLIRGEISLAEGQTVPDKTVAFLVPAESERAAEVLRYFAAYRITALDMIYRMIVR